MNIRLKLKERLLEIPYRSKAYREKHLLANDLNVEVEDVERLLNELVDKNILKGKIEYICTNCKDTTIMDNELLEEILDEENYFECDNCENCINSLKDVTGSVYYDIQNEAALMEWK